MLNICISADQISVNDRLILLQLPASLRGGRSTSPTSFSVSSCRSCILRRPPYFLLQCIDRGMKAQRFDRTKLVYSNKLQVTILHSYRLSNVHTLAAISRVLGSILDVHFHPHQR